MSYITVDGQGLDIIFPINEKNFILILRSHVMNIYLKDELFVIITGLFFLLMY